MEYTFEDRCWIWLSSVNGMTPRRFYKLLTQAEDPKSVWEEPGEYASVLDEATKSELMKAHTGEYMDKLFALLDSQHIRAIPRSSDLYPDELQHIHDAPVTLYVKGVCPLDAEKQLAIVGTRSPGYDGEKAARSFARALAENGVTVVSGLARGIDTCAHSGCLDGSGRTIAVLGNGLMSVYPPENEKLAARILDSGGALVSEMRPWDTPTRWSFPQRNRIIAGLSAATLVVEGGEKSGALITAGYALEDGREVFAVPGSPFNQNSAGPNKLIQNGAYPVLSHWDMLEALRWGSRPSASKPSNQVLELDENETMVYNQLKPGAKSFDELQSSTSFPVSKLNSLLTMLTLRGVVIKLPGNLYRLA